MDHDAWEYPPIKDNPTIPLWVMVNLRPRNEWPEVGLEDSKLSEPVVNISPSLGTVQSYWSNKFCGWQIPESDWDNLSSIQNHLLSILHKKPPISG